MTGAEIRAALNSRLSKSEAADGINTEINAALEDISKRAHWPDLHTTDTTTLAFTSGLKLKALPADFQAEDRLYVSDDRTLESEHPDTLRALQEQESPSSGDPTRYAIFAGSVYVYPLPDASVTFYLDYWFVPATVTDETQDLVLGDEFKEAMIAATIVAYLKKTGFTVHPKFTENQSTLNNEIAKLLPTRDAKPTVTQPYRYGT